jgi:hypothetical protein
MAKSEEMRQDTMKTHNKAEVAGYLKIVNLEKKKNDEKENVIQGSITIQYGEADDNQVEVKVYKKELTANGNVAKAYEKLVDLMDNGITMAKAQEMSAKSEDERTFEATKVRIWGNGDFTPELRLNEYYREDGEYSCRPEVSMGFGNIGLDVDSEKFKGSFENVIFVHKTPKMEKDKDGDETGRLIIEGLYVDYKNKVKPLTFVVADEEIVEGMEDVEKGDTIEVFGQVKIAKIVKTKVKKSGFGGKGKVEEDVSFVSELLVVGGNPIEEDESRWIDPAFIKKALVERETFLEELKKEASEDKGKEKKNGFKGKKSKKSEDETPF